MYMGHWLMDTAGIGSIIVLGVGLSVAFAYVYMLRWILCASREPVPAEVGTKDEEESIVVEAGGEKA
jgi:hypothetical protein